MVTIIYFETVTMEINKITRILSFFRRTIRRKPFNDEEGKRRQHAVYSFEHHNWVEKVCGGRMYFVDLSKKIENTERDFSVRDVIA